MGTLLERYTRILNNHKHGKMTREISHLEIYIGGPDVIQPTLRAMQLSATSHVVSRDSEYFPDP